jgi:hypothetical protein
VSILFIVDIFAGQTRLRLPTDGWARSFTIGEVVISARLRASTEQRVPCSPQNNRGNVGPNLRRLGCDDGWTADGRSRGVPRRRWAGTFTGAHCRRPVARHSAGPTRLVSSGGGRKKPSLQSWRARLLTGCEIWPTLRPTLSPAARRATANPSDENIEEIGVQER